MIEPLRTLIIKPTLDCNLACSYCFYHDNKPKDRMTMETFENILMKLKPDTHYATIWHGGEPMTVGIDFYKKALELLAQYRIKTSNMIQTNLTLLDDEWIQLFRKYSFVVGTSLDGVREHHNKYRCNTFDTVTENMRRLYKNGVGCNIVAVMHEDTLEYVNKNFEMFKELYRQRVSVKIGMEIHEEQKYDERRVKRFSSCLLAYHDLWKKDKRLKIFPMKELYTLRQARKNRLDCTYKGNCIGRFFAISPKGDVVPCGRFVGSELVANNPMLRYGNVNDPDFSFDENKVVQELCKLNRERIMECQGCRYFELCYGDCLFHGLNDGLNKVLMCPVKTRLFEAMDEDDIKVVTSQEEVFSNAGLVT